MKSKIMDWAFSQPLTSAQKFLLVGLAYESSDSGEVLLRIETLVFQTGSDPRTVSRNLRYLEGAGYFEDTRKRFGKTNQYRLIRLNIPETQPERGRKVYPLKEEVSLPLKGVGFSTPFAAPSLSPPVPPLSYPGTVQGTVQGKEGSTKEVQEKEKEREAQAAREARGATREARGEVSSKPKKSASIRITDEARALVQEFKSRFPHYKVPDPKDSERELQAAVLLLATSAMDEILDTAAFALKDKFAGTRAKAATLTKLKTHYAEIRAVLPPKAVPIEALYLPNTPKTNEEIQADWQEYLDYCKEGNKEPDRTYEPAFLKALRMAQEALGVSVPHPPSPLERLPGKA